MSLMSSLYMMKSGLSVSQSGLNVTSHNMSNTNTPGYCRQRITQSDSYYRTIGNGMKVGTGVDIEQLQQVRNTFLDISYREEASRKSYHEKIVRTVDEVENILGEINGESISIEMRDLWQSIDTLASHPEGIETQKGFLDKAVGFIDKANAIHDKIIEYQFNLDGQIKEAVSNINDISSQIAEYNLKISKYETSGDHANDYRDQRNLLLDKLSTYGQIDVSEDKSGQVSVLFEGHALLTRTDVNHIGLRYLNDASGQSFIEPVWTSDTNILSVTDKTAKPVYAISTLQETNSVNRTDNGSLRAMLVSRGTLSANNAQPVKVDDTIVSPTPDENIDGFVIPTIQKEFDTLITSIVGMLNDAVNPKDTALNEKPYDYFGKQGNSGKDIDGDGIDDNEPIFVTIDPSKGYTSGNLKVNPALLTKPSKLALSSDGSAGDTTIIQDILTKWQQKDGEFSPSCAAVGKSQNFEDYYSELVSRMGSIGQKSTALVNTQNDEITRINNKRQEVSGVSLDEEMSHMLIYHHAYNASAKVYNVIDSMLQSVINMV